MHARATVDVLFRTFPTPTRATPRSTFLTGLIGARYLDAFAFYAIVTQN